MLFKKDTITPGTKAPDGTLVLTAKQVNDIALLMGGTIIKDGQDLVDKLSRSQQIRMGDGIELRLNSDDLWALRQQSIGMSRDYVEYVSEFVADAVTWQLQGPAMSWRR